MLVLTVLDGAQAGTRVRVRGTRFTIGRSWMNDLPLAGADHVSARHGELVQTQDGEWSFTDLGSTNGSALLRANDRGFEDLRGKERSVQELGDGDELHLGDPKGPVRVTIEVTRAADQSLSRSFVVPLDPSSGSASVEGLLADRQRGPSFQKFLARLVQDLDLEPTQRLLAEVLLDSFEALNHVAIFAPGAYDPELLRHRPGAEPDPDRPFTFPLGLIGQVSADGHPVLFQDAPSELLPDGTAARLHITCGFCVPLRGPSGGDAGILIADARSDDGGQGGRPAELTVDELGGVSVFAEHAGRVIGAARQRRADAEALAAARAENVRLEAAAAARVKLDGIVGDHPALLEVIARIERVASFPTAVLIQGETGTGKEGIARAVHQLSDRADRAFIAVNCAAIPANLLESELFGHLKGAFTGADRPRPGLFDEADGGTLFLDEIGDVPMELQAKLLRVLQEGEFFAVGARQPTRVDVRIVAATHRDLTAEVAAGGFREDLLYRLNVFPVELPPLRDRRSDIAGLATHFAGLYGERFGRGALTLDAFAIRRLESEDWPGNIRELQNRIERGVILADGDTITLRDVAAPGEAPVGAGDDEPISRGGALLARDGTVLPMKEARALFSKLQVNEALRQADGVQKRAAELLGLDAGNFSRLLKELGLR